MTENHAVSAATFRTPAEILADARAERDRLIGENRAGFAELERMGAQVDPSGLLSGRIDILAQMFFGSEESPGFIEFQLRFERRVAEVLEEARGEIRKARLAAGAGQVAQQMAAQSSGLLGPNGRPIR